MPASTSLLHRIALVTVLLATAGIYVRTGWHDFAYDDRHYVMAPTDLGQPNEMVASWQGVTTYFTTFYGTGVMSEGRNFRPVTTMSYALVHLLCDGDGPVRAGPQHLVNVGFHVLGTLLVFLLLRKLFNSPLPALAGAAVFGLHALRSDPVIAIVGRAELLGFCFGATALLTCLKALDAPRKARIALLALAACAMFLALGSKESALPWVVFVPLFRWAQRGTLRGEWLPLLATIGTAIAAFVPLWLPILLGSPFEVDNVFNPLAAEHASARFRTAVSVLGHAALQVLLPLHLTIDYGFRQFEIIDRWTDWRFLIAMTGLLAALILGVRHARRHPALFLATALFFGFTFSTSNVLVVVETIYAERFMYTATTGMALLVAWSVDHVGRSDSRLPARILVTCGTAWLLWNGILIAERCEVFRNNEALLTHEAEANPRSMRLQQFRANHLVARGEAIRFAGDDGQQILTEWKRCVDRSLAVHPTIRHPQALTDLALFHLITSELLREAGRAAAAKAERSEAERVLEEALSSPLLQKPISYRAHHQLALIDGIEGRPAAERVHLEDAIQANPRVSQSYRKLAQWEMRHGTPQGALRALTDGLQQLPTRIDLRTLALQTAWDANLGAAFITLLETAERLHGVDHPLVQIHRALRAAREGDDGTAVRLFELALPNLAHPPAATFTSLPRSLARMGRKPDAIRFLRQHLGRPGLDARVRAEMGALLRDLESKRP